MGLLVARRTELGELLRVILPFLEPVIARLSILGVGHGLIGGWSLASLGVATRCSEPHEMTRCGFGSRLYRRVSYRLHFGLTIFRPKTDILVAVG
jgi:hypothetical protein